VGSSTVTASSHARFVEAHFTVKEHSGDEYGVLCPSHGDRNASMRINVAKGVFFCHGCHISGGMKKLAKLVGVHYTWDRTEEALHVLTTKLAKLRAQQDGTDVPTWLPEDTLDRYRYESGYWTEHCGFTQDIIDTFDLGYDIMAEAAVIPVRDYHGRLLGVTKRFLGPDAQNRYKDPKGFDKKHNLFGSWLAVEHPSSTVVLCEGPKDAMKVWQAGFVGLAQYGTYVTAEQIKILRRMGTVTVVLFYDNDAGGETAHQGAKGFTERSDGSWRYDRERDLRRHFLVKRVRYGKLRKKDPGDMTVDEIKARIASSRFLMR